jgi:hypothetical protein
MIPLAIPGAALALARSWWKAGLGVVIGAALALPVGQCQGANAEKSRQAARNAEAALQAEIRNTAAKEAAAAQRAADLARVTAAEKGRTDAIRAGADEAPSGPELRLACERLRAQGTAAARLPAVCRPHNPAQAPTDR